MPLLNSPTFVAYAITAVVLVLNLMGLWGLSGFRRAKSKVAINPEDAAAFGGRLEATDPPAVARVLRAHSNAQATIMPFLVLGLIYALAGGDATFAQIVFGVFVAARLLHSAFYLAGKQPLRTIAFGISALSLLVLAGGLVCLVVRGLAA